MVNGLFTFACCCTISGFVCVKVIWGVILNLFLFVFYRLVLDAEPYSKQLMGFVAASNSSLPV